MSENYENGVFTTKMDVMYSLRLALHSYYQWLLPITLSLLY